jgi:hypothetical protein
VFRFNYFDVLCIIFFKEHLPEDGHSRWPKHVEGFAVYNTLNLHICLRIFLESLRLVKIVRKTDTLLEDLGAFMITMLTADSNR